MGNPGDDQEKVQEASNNQPEASISYNDLNNLAMQLSQENQKLYYRIQELNNIFKRLDYLLNIVGMSNNMAFPSSFIEECVKEIMDIMTPDKEEEVEVSADENV